MRKYVFSLILILSLSVAGQAQNVDNLLKKAAKAENVEKVKIGGFLMSLAKMCGGFNDTPELKGLSGVEIYDLSDCNMNLKAELKREFDKIKDGNGYETLMYVKDDGDGIRIMIKKNNKNVIKEIVFLCMDKEDPAIIKLSGKIKESDIAQLVNEYSK